MKIRIKGELEVVMPDNLRQATVKMGEFYKFAKAAGMFAFDTETSGLSWLRDNLLMISFYTPGMSLVLPLSWSESTLSLGDVKELTLKLFSDKNLVCFGHNIKFDMHFLKNWGVQIKNEIHDTIVMNFMIDVRRPAKLKALAQQELGLPMIEFKKLFTIGGKQKLTLLDHPCAVVGKYAARDAFATYSLADKMFELGAVTKHKLSGKLRAEDDVALLYDSVVSHMIRILFKMERRGVRMDREKLSAAAVEYGVKCEELSNTILQIAGRDFNMRSPKQVKEVFMDRGIQLESTNEKALKVLNDPLAKAMLDYREAFKIKSTYLDTFLELLDRDDRIHTSYNSHVAKTGRISSSNPVNLMNIPRDKWMREMFVAPPGKKLIVRDYGQLELRILAVVAEDPVMIQEFKDGKDLHRQNASQMFAIPYDDVTKEQRQIAKSGTSFGVIYGMSARSLAVMCNISEDDAESLINMIFWKYKKVDQWIKRVHMSGMKCGYCKTFMGRRRDIPDVYSTDRGKRNYGLRQLQNTPIQGGAADLVQNAMVIVDRNKDLKNMGCQMLIQCHDELILEVPEENAEEANDLVTYLMSNFDVLDKIKKAVGVEFPTSGGIGNNWHAAKGE